MREQLYQQIMSHPAATSITLFPAIDQQPNKALHVALLFFIAITFFRIDTMSRTFAPTRSEALFFGGAEVWLAELDQHYSHLANTRSFPDDPILIPPGLLPATLLLLLGDRAPTAANHSATASNNNSAIATPLTGRSNFNNHYTDHAYRTLYLKLGSQFLSSNLLWVRQISNLFWLINGLAIACHISRRTQRHDFAIFTLLFYLTSPSILALTGIFAPSNFILSSWIALFHATTQTRCQIATPFARCGRSWLAACWLGLIAAATFFTGGFWGFMLGACCTWLAVALHHGKVRLGAGQYLPRRFLFAIAATFFLGIWAGYGFSLVATTDHRLLEFPLAINSISIPLSEMWISALSSIFSSGAIINKQFCQIGTDLHLFCYEPIARVLSLLIESNPAAFLLFISLAGPACWRFGTAWRKSQQPPPGRRSPILGHPLDSCLLIGVLAAALHLYFTGRIGIESDIRRTITIIYNLALGGVICLFILEHFPRWRDKQRLFAVTAFWAVSAALSVTLYPFYNLANFHLPQFKVFSTEGEASRHHLYLRRQAAATILTPPAALSPFLVFGSEAPPPRHRFTGTSYDLTGLEFITTPQSTIEHRLVISSKLDQEQALSICRTPSSVIHNLSPYHILITCD